MALLRSPDGTWTGEIVRPEDVVNLKCRGYVEVEAVPVVEFVEVEFTPEPKPELEPELVKGKGKSTEA